MLATENTLRFTSTCETYTHIGWKRSSLYAQTLQIVFVRFLNIANSEAKLNIYQELLELKKFVIEVSAAQETLKTEDIW